MLKQILVLTRVLVIHIFLTGSVMSVLAGKTERFDVILAMSGTT